MATESVIKLPRRTQDYTGKTYKKLEYLKTVITKLFEKYNGEFIETPVFELTHVLTDKYGEEEKLIYNIESIDEDITDDIIESFNEKKKTYNHKKNFYKKKN